MVDPRLHRQEFQWISLSQALGAEEINRKIQREGDSSGDGLLVYNVYNVFNPI